MLTEVQASNVRTLSLQKAAKSGTYPFPSSLVLRPMDSHLSGKRRRIEDEARFCTTKSITYH